MNFTKLSIFLFIIIVFTSCEKNEKIEGKWYVEKFQNQKGEFKKSSNKWIDFFKDGTLIGGKNGELEVKNGIWKYDLINKTLIIESKKKYQDNGIYTLEKLNEKKMVLLKDSMRVFFKKER